MAETRRVRLTKRLMKDALLELMEEKPFAKISVTELCERADVNRSTFYAHYDDTAALLAELEDEALAGMPVMGGGSFEDELTRYFDHMRENAALFRTLIVRRGSEDFTRRIVDASLARYRPGGAKAALTERYAYVFYIHGVIGILTGWLTDGFPLPSRELARLILSLCRI